jgi:formylglycine-generating enzyme required for sulfatase activity
VGQFRQFAQATGFRTDAEKEGGKVMVYDPAAPAWPTVMGLSWRQPGIPQEETHPVVAVSWNDAVAFCKWLSEREGKIYRLPTEAEWEFACRAGTTTAWSVGDNEQGLRVAANIADESYRQKHPGAVVAPWNDGFAYTAPVGSFQPNAFGLYDMLGNVWERCQDWWDAKYYDRSPVSDPQGPDSPVPHPIYGGCRVARGGAYDLGPYACRSGWHKGADLPANATQYTGFRVVCECGRRLAGPAVRDGSGWR